MARLVSLLRVSVPTYPVAVADLRADLAIDWSDADNDARLLRLLKAATDEAEQATGRAFAAGRWRAAWHDVSAGDVLLLPRAPLVTLHSRTADGEAVGDDDLSPMLDAEPPRLTAENDLGAVRVEWTAGYGDGLLPFDVAAAIRLRAGFLHRFPEGVAPSSIREHGAVEALLSNYRILDHGGVL